MAKRVFVATSGSRGDVEPFIALCKTLNNAGYDVILSAPPDYAQWITSHGVAHHPAGEPMMINMSAFAEAIETNKFIQAMARAGREERLRALFKSVGEASEGADLLIYSPMLMILTFIAEARGTSAIGVYLAPAFPTKDFAVPFQSRFSYGRFFIASRIARWT